MTYEDLQRIIPQIERNGQAVVAAAAGLTGRELRYRADPGKWCILEILGHLADTEIVYAHRLRQALAERDPTFAVMEQDDWARNLGYLDAPVAELLDVFRANRAATLRLLRRLKAEDLERGGFHPEVKRKMTVAELVDRIVKHDPNHLGQMERLRQAAAQS